MSFIRRYAVIIGLLILACVIVLLLSAPGPVFSSGVTFIDTELHRSSGDEAYVRTKMDFGSQEHMSGFPTEIGDWEGYDYDTKEDKDKLGADVILLRGYSSPGVYQPIFFLIMQAKTESSFHPPHICYASQGYKVQEEAKERVLLEEASWTEEPSSMWIPLARLVVTKEHEQKVIERRVVLFCYVKGNQFTSDTITMLRVEALAPIDHPYDGILNLEKDFIAQAIPYMFEPAESSEWNPLVLRLVGLGAGGYCAIAFMLIVPLAIIVYPGTRWGRHSIEKSEDET